MSIITINIWVGELDFINFKVFGKGGELFLVGNHRFAISRFKEENKSCFSPVCNISILKMYKSTELTHVSISNARRSGLRLSRLPRTSRISGCVTRTQASRRNHNIFEVKDISPPPESLGLHSLPPVRIFE